MSNTILSPANYVNANYVTANFRHANFVYLPNLWLLNSNLIWMIFTDCSKKPIRWQRVLLGAPNSKEGTKYNQPTNQPTNGLVIAQYW